MQPIESMESISQYNVRLQYLLSSNPQPYASQPPPMFLNTLINTNTTPNFFQTPNQAHEFASNNSTSDESEEQQLSIINERKQRRMISNRESARRSRMRKQKHLDELWSQAMWLRNENHQLLNKLNHVSKSHEQVIQENSLLKEEACELRLMLMDMQIHSPYSNTTLREFDDSFNDISSSPDDLL